MKVSLIANKRLIISYFVKHVIPAFYLVCPLKCPLLRSTCVSLTKFLHRPQKKCLDIEQWGREGVRKESSEKCPLSSDTPSRLVYVDILKHGPSRAHKYSGHILTHHC